MDRKDEKKDVLKNGISKAEIQNHISYCNFIISIDEAEPISFNNNYEDCLIGKRNIF
jgi:hypothetical protein